ncbi:unnamed protein product [marine sediment metagenome]|uniref:Uncharacterized protein n=1 Tax=marine sediment metagenome TaxID=412755 RepID=X1FPI8_9ZZZZ
MEPGTGLLIFIVAGIAGVTTYGAYGFAKKAGPELEASDLLPMPPPYPPLPRFMYEKPELLQSLRR